MDGPFLSLLPTASRSISRIWDTCYLGHRPLTSPPDFLRWLRSKRLFNQLISADRNDVKLIFLLIIFFHYRPYAEEKDTDHTTVVS